MPAYSGLFGSSSRKKKDKPKKKKDKPLSPYQKHKAAKLAAEEAKMSPYQRAKARKLRAKKSAIKSAYPMDKNKVKRKTVRKKTVRVSSKVPAAHRAKVRQLSEESKKKKVAAAAEKKKKLATKAVTKPAAKTVVKPAAKKPDVKKIVMTPSTNQTAKKTAAKKPSKKSYLGKFKGIDFIQKARRKKLGIKADERAGRVGAKAKKAVKTKGGTYVKYEKDSVSAKSFNSAFKKSCTGGAKGFTWQGRKYSCKKA